MGRGNGRKHFLQALKERFPELAALIDPTARGLLHCEMDPFSEATQEALDRGDEMAVKAYFALAEELLEQAGPELASALQTSYLEYIDFDKAYPNNVRPRSLLPPLLRRSLAELEAHLRKIDDHIRRTREREDQ
jgi:hypothetical protein